MYKSGPNVGHANVKVMASEGHGDGIAKLHRKKISQRHKDDPQG